MAGSIVKVINTKKRYLAVLGVEICRSSISRSVNVMHFGDNPFGEKNALKDNKMIEMYKQTTQ